MKKIETKTDDKDKALEQVMAEIEKQFGKGAIMKLGSDSHIEIETTPSGSLALDVALGVGGFPKGRIIEVLVQNLLVKRQLHYKQLQRFKSVEDVQHSLMLNML